MGSVRARSQTCGKCNPTPQALIRNSEFGIMNSRPSTPVSCVAGGLDAEGGLKPTLRNRTICGPEVGWALAHLQFLSPEMRIKISRPTSTCVQPRGRVGGIPNSEFRIPNSSNWVWNIDEFDVETVMVRDPSSESTDAESLGGVVTRRQIVDPILGGLVEDPFRGLACDICIETGGDGLVKFLLCTAGDDPHRRHQMISAGKGLRFALAGFFDGGDELLQIDRFLKDPADAGGCAEVDAEGLELLEADAVGELCRVAELQVSVEGQMVGDERDPVFDQEPEAFAVRPDDSGRFRRVPENPVVDDDRVRFALDGAAKEITRSGDRGDDLPYVRCSLDLEAVGSIVGRTVGLEELVELGHELQEVHGPMVAQPAGVK